MFSISNFSTVKIGDLSKGINRHATNPSMLFGSTYSSEHNIPANNTIAWQRSFNALPKVRLHEILLQKSASSFKGLCEHLVLIIHSLTKSAFTPSKIMLKGPRNIMISFDGFAFDGFWWSCFWRQKGLWKPLQCFHQRFIAQRWRWGPKYLAYFLILKIYIPYDIILLWKIIQVLFFE